MQVLSSPKKNKGWENSRKPKRPNRANEHNVLLYHIHEPASNLSVLCSHLMALQNKVKGKNRQTTYVVNFLHL